MTVRQTLVLEKVVVSLAGLWPLRLVERDTR